MGPGGWLSKEMCLPKSDSLNSVTIPTWWKENTNPSGFPLASTCVVACLHLCTYKIQFKTLKIQSVSVLCLCISEQYLQS